MAIAGVASTAGAQQFLDARSQHLPISDLATYTAFDWNNDGSADLLTDDETQLRLLLNDGTGAFSFANLPLNSPSPPFSQSRQLLAGHIDGDGVPELVVVVGLEVHLIAGSFPAAVLATDFGPHQLQFADIDGDGFNDLCAFSRTAVNIHWGGSSGLAAPTRIPVPILRDADVGDLDNDGDLDFVFGNGLGADWIRNDGSRNFAHAGVLLAGGDHAGVFVRDLDGDNVQDLILSPGIQHPFTTDAVVCLGTGGGSFAMSQSLGLVGSGGIRVADVDGDQDLDVVAQVGLDGVRVLTNDGLGAFSTAYEARWPGFSFPEFLVDLDLDGDPDLIGAQWFRRTSFSTTQVTGLAMNDGTGGFFPYQSDTVPTDNTVSTYADFNGDGFDDVMTQETLHFGDGGGGFVGAIAVPALAASNSTTLRSVIADDLDMDGDQDLVVASNLRVHLLFNDGSGVFQETSFFSFSLGVSFRGIAVGDLDGDGDRDVLVTKPNLLLRNTGGGTYAPSSALSLPDMSTVAFADFDGDLDLDLLADPGVFLVNDGSGNFVDQTAAWLPSGLPGSSPLGIVSQVRVEDFNGDGRPDALFNGFILENTGTAFVDQTGVWYSRGSTFRGPIPLDVDLDGDVDLVRNDLGQLMLFRNDGTGVMTASLAAAPFSDLSSDPFPLDADGDGDPDLVIRTVASTIVLSNLHRQLVSPLSPEPGQAYSLDIYARPDYPAGDLALVGVSLTELSPPWVLPQGNHWLDPATEVILGLAALPTGQANISFAIPPFTDLAGLEIFFQGWILGVDDRFTNVIRDRVRF